MKKFFTSGLIAIAFVAMTSSTQAQKIGYISADEVIALMPEASKVDIQLNEYQQALYQAAQAKKDAFDQAVAKFYKDSTSMSPSLKEVQRSDLQKQVQELSGAEQKIQQQFDAKRQELSLPIQKKLQAAIQEVAKENGYTYVFPREALLVMPPSDDLGSLVKRKLGIKDVPKTMNPAGKK